MAYNSKYTGEQVEALLDKADGLSLSDYLTREAAEETYQPKLLTWGNGNDNDFFGRMEIRTLGTLTTLTYAESVGDVQNIGTIRQINNIGTIDETGYIGTITNINNLGIIDAVGTITRLGAIVSIGQIGALGYNTRMFAGTLAVETEYGFTWNGDGLLTEGSLAAVLERMSSAEDDIVSLKSRTNTLEVEVGTLSYHPGATWVGTFAGEWVTSGTLRRSQVYPRVGSVLADDVILNIGTNRMMFHRVTGVDGDDVTYTSLDESNAW